MSSETMPFTPPTSLPTVRAATGALRKSCAAPPRPTDIPSVEVHEPVTFRSGDGQAPGAVYRVSRDGSRVFVRTSRPLPPLWDTVFLEVAGIGPGGTSAHLRGTVIWQARPTAPGAESAFALRLYQVGGESDLEAWCSLVASRIAAADVAAAASPRRIA